MDRELTQLIDRFLSASDPADKGRVAEEILDRSRQQYDSIARVYAARRGDRIHEYDLLAWREILELARARVPPDRSIAVLDVGTAFGKDLIFASHEPRVTVHGIEISDGFLQLLAERESRGEIPRGSFSRMDARSMSAFADEAFDVVRHNASLVHMPIIGPGYTVDCALAESRRVLRDSGLLFASFKEGEGIAIVESHEGFSATIVQHYTVPLIHDLFERNQLAIIARGRRASSRGQGLTWLSVVAEKSSPVT